MTQLSAEPICVLYVSGNPDSVEQSLNLCEQKDERFTVLTVASAKEARDYVDEKDVDCIVSQYDLPGNDGIEFLNTVRADHPDLPFILITSSGSESLASDAISAGVTDYFGDDGGADLDEQVANRITTAVTHCRSHQQSADAEQRLRELTEATTDVHWICTADWKDMLFVNSAYEDLWGQSMDRLADDPMAFLEGIHPEDRNGVEHAMEQLSSGEPADLEFRVNPTDESQTWVWAQGEPIYDEAGNLVRIAGYVRDITERKQRKQELEHQRSVLESVIETIPDGILVVNENREFFTYNERFVEMWKIPQDIVDTGDDHQALQSVLDSLEHPDEFLETVEYCYKNPHEESRDVIRLVDGRIFERFTGPVIDDAGASYGRIWLFRDITEQKDREQELQQHNDQLDKFASVVSHDLRNPLNVAQLRLDLAQNECDTDHLDKIAEAHTRMEDLIDDLLMLARGGDQLTEQIPITLDEFAENCWKTVETADTTLVTESSQTIWADENRLKQLLENLFRNAVEHGGEDITVVIGEVDGGFYIADDGSGIPENERDQVFEKGYSTLDGGTGFGLMIVREIIEAHGWEITVTESDEGGARFEITGVESV